MYHLQTILTIICCILLLSGCNTKPPKESNELLKGELVEIIQLDSSIHLDIRYATANNFTGKPVYKQAMAFLQKDAAIALLKAHKTLNEQGYGLIVFDGYRPWNVTKKFWELTAKEHKQFVANPRKGSRHNRGCAVDVSLYELKTGKEVIMTGGYDEWSERSYPNYTGGTKQQRKLRDLLRHTMEANGFTVYETEWWHFDFKDWKKYRIQNISFEEIK